MKFLNAFHGMRTLCILLASLMIFSAVMMTAGCEKTTPTEVDPATDESADVSSETATDIESTVEEETTTPESDEPTSVYPVSSFDTEGEWAGDGAIVSDDPTPHEGDGCIRTEKNGDIVIYRLFDPVDLNAYIGGYVHLCVYVDTTEYIVGGQIELSSSGTADVDEIHWGEFGLDIVLEPGWNELVLPFSEGITVSEIGNQHGYPNFGMINYCRIYLNVRGGVTVFALDDFYLYTTGENTITEIRQELDSFDGITGWNGYTDLIYGDQNSMTNTPYVMQSGNGDIVMYKSFSEPLDLTLFKNDGTFHIWLYTSHANVVIGGQIELTSSGGADSYEAHWSFGQDFTLKDGWNELNLRLSDLMMQGGDADLSRINYCRIYLNSYSDCDLGADDAFFVLRSNKKIVIVKTVCGDSETALQMFPGAEINLSDCVVDEVGYDVIGWTDGTDKYGINDRYTAGEENVTLTAIREEWPRYEVTYTDGNETVTDTAAYADTTVKTAVCTFEKPGSKFIGWTDKEYHYKSGLDYRVKAGENCLTALWSAIPDYDLIKDAQEAWDLDDGGAADYARSVISATDGELKWTVWLNSDSFGQVLDFSCEGSIMKVKDSRADLSGDFTVAAFIQAPVKRGEGTERTVISGGSAWTLMLDTDGRLSFTAKGVEGLSAAGDSLTDGLWHHVMVTREKDTVLYYVDGVKIDSFTVSGSVAASDRLYLGNQATGKKGLDGSLAQVRIWGSAKTPEEATKTVILASDNEKKEPRLSLKHGITTDRSQGFGTKGGTILPSDVKFCREMGLDFMRMMVYVDNLVGPDGSLQTEYIEWAKDFCQTIIDNGLPCVMSLGCGDRDKWNGKYLGTQEGFETVVTFYGELAEWIRAQGWTADEFGLLLFTEPVNASNGSMDWTWMSDRIVAAVRNVLPDMTIITSSDASGNISRLMEMSPMTDSNLIYSFTSYEPYVVGFNTFQGYPTDDSPWLWVGDVPYPIEEGVDYTDAIEKAIENVPESGKEEVRSTLTDYVNGVRDSWMPNSFGGLYNADWLMTRASVLHDWSESNGGNIHMLVAEFGCCDAETNQKLFAAKPGSGLVPETRLRLVRDSRLAYEAFDIGWAFWQYNESFTILNPRARSPFGAVNESMYRSLVDVDLLEALGLDYNAELFN